MKKLLALALSAVLVLGLFGCGAKDSSSLSQAPSSAPLPVSAPPAEPEKEPLPLATDFNALTGLPRAEGMLDGQRPVAVMVANNARALPQRGLASADVVYEMLTEGGITRLMALYADYRTLPQVGPVRSTRDQFVQFAYPSSAILAHIGSSVYARNLMNVLQYQGVDGLYLGSTAFLFDTARSLPKPGGKLNEYCWFTDAALLWQGMEAVDVAPTGEVRSLFRFSPEAAVAVGDAPKINVAYSGVSSASFRYRPKTGLYSKNISGAAHKDEDGTQLTFTNLIFLYCPITLKPDSLLTEFDLTGGTGVYFTAGGVQNITWEKGKPEDALRLYAPDGSELLVQQGKSYIGILPSDAGPDALRITTTAELDAAAAEKAAADEKAAAEAQAASEAQAAAAQAAAEEAENAGS